jgi:hypothetical protein
MSVSFFVQKKTYTIIYIKKNISIPSNKRRKHQNTNYIILFTFPSRAASWRFWALSVSNIRSNFLPHTLSLSLGSESDLLSYAALSPSLFVSVYFCFSLARSCFDFVFVFVRLQALQIGFISSYLDFSPMNEVVFFFIYIFLNTPFINLLYSFLYWSVCFPGKRRKIL